MILPDKVYNILKWILLTAIAPTVTLIEGLGVLYHFETKLIVATISLVATFVGALINISNVNYCKNNKDIISYEIKE